MQSKTNIKNKTIYHDNPHIEVTIVFAEYNNVLACYDKNNILIIFSILYSIVLI